MRSSPKRTNKMPEESPILTALKKHAVSAEVTDLDHFRIHGGMAVETDYIVTVKPTIIPNDKEVGAEADNNRTEEEIFDTFTVSKSYSAFRAFATSLKKTADSYTQTSGYSSRNNNDPITPTTRGTTSGGEQPLSDCSDAIKVAKYCELVSHLIESQRTQYLGKVNYMFVKTLAKQRCQIINDVLEATCTYFPTCNLSLHPLLQDVSTIIETFFLTDHCEAVVPIPEQSLFNKHKKKLSSGGSDGGSMNPLNWIGGAINNNNSKGDLKVEVRSGEFSSTGGQRGKPRSKSVVVPRSTKARKSDSVREQEERELDQAGDEAGFMLEESALGGGSSLPDPPQLSSLRKSRQARFNNMVPNYSRPTPAIKSGGSKFGDWIETNPVAFVGIASIALYLLHRAAMNTVRIDGDMALLVIFAAFCFGLHMPRPMMGGYDVPHTMKAAIVREDIAGRRLLRRSIMASTPRNAMNMTMKRMSIRDLAGSAGSALEDELLAEDDELMMEEEPTILRSPLPVFPPGAKIGSHVNCWSEPDPGNFQVRGPNYLEDHKKVASGEFLFPTRGVDLFLTDTCPENVGTNSSVFGGNLRDKPTFILNFRLPWGVLLFYFEIPDMFIPFVKACYDEDGYDKSTLPSMDDMSPGERAACRFLLNDMAYKNGTLKIVPYVVDGPWVVKQVVGGKPAIIGNKLPVNYVYQPEEKGGKALYIEADLDIAGSSAARGILSVARSYTNILTLDLGFVVQGNAEDELPECMLVGCRIHGVDPLTAPSLPPSPELFMAVENMNADGIYGDDETSVSPEVDSVRPVIMARD